MGDNGHALSPVVVRRAEVLGRDHSVLRLRLLEGPLEGSECGGVLCPEFGEAPEVGSVVGVNTVGLEMGLGTGGLAFVLPESGGEAPLNRDHFIKLPYTPLQFPVEKAGRSVKSLAGIPVVVLPLHSHLAPACCAAQEIKPEAKVSFVWQEGGALPVVVSRVVPELKELGLLHRVVSSGSCFGGDIEAVNLYDALLAAAFEVGDLVLVGIGPGIVGSGRELAHGGMSAAIALNAAASLGGEPVLAPRISSADGRERHRGVSHHTRSVLEVALTGCRVAIPNGAEIADLEVGLPERHSYERVEGSASGLEGRYGVIFRSMGRGYVDDPVFFDAAVCAVKLAMEGAE